MNKKNNGLLTVMKFEFMAAIKNRSFIITTAIIIISIIIACLIPVAIGIYNNISKGNSNKKDKLAIYYVEQGDFKLKDLETNFPQFIWSETNDFDSVSELIETDEFEVGLYLSNTNYKIVSKSDKLGGVISETAVLNMIKTNNQNEFYNDMNLSETEIDYLFGNSITGEFISIGMDISQTYWIGYVMIMLLYFSIVLNGQSIMTSVATEKSTKTMEILITSVDTSSLIFGKVIGVAFAGLLQLSSYILTAIIGFALTSSSWGDFSPQVLEVVGISLSPKIMILSIVFFILGFLVYSFLYAGFASTISRIEDASSVAMIPTTLILIAFFISISLAAIPNSMIVKVTSYIPFLSPFVMFMRVCVTDVAPLAIIIGILINIATVILSGLFGTKLYKVGVLMYGNSPSIMETIKMIFKSDK